MIIISIFRIVVRFYGGDTTCNINHNSIGIDDITDGSFVSILVAVIILLPLMLVVVLVLVSLLVTAVIFLLLMVLLKVKIGILLLGMIKSLS